MCIMANRFHTSHLEHCFSSPLVWFVIVICENRRKKKEKEKTVRDRLNELVSASLKTVVCLWLRKNTDQRTKLYHSV